MCDKGYVDTQGAMCGACAEGFGGYPDCRRKSEAEDRDAMEQRTEDRCRLPLLPTALEPLREDRVHLQGIYFLDTTRRHHVMAVHAKAPSLLRVQASGMSPTHSVRVKVALEKLAGSKHGVIAQETWEVLHEGDQTVESSSCCFLLLNASILRVCLTLNALLCCEACARCTLAHVVCSSCCKFVLSRDSSPAT
jgi:hypothetical protein